MIGPLLITGATGGLGAEVVRRLSESYECVALVRGAVPEGLRGVQADLSDAGSVRDAIRSLGQSPFGLVHLAGGFETGSLAETSDEVWAKMVGLNLTGAFVAIRETLAVMDRALDGRIVVISSDAARTKAAGSVAYTVSKSGLNTLVEVVAKEVAKTRITVNALMPSSLDTPAMRQFMPREKLVPLARVAETIAFLLSPEAASINGALIPLTAA
jgi:NAD(P)-dependent dehydrogenase (short-subunit alcohol dehydrogenase family)